VVAGVVRGSAAGITPQVLATRGEVLAVLLHHSSWYKMRFWITVITEFRCQHQCDMNHSCSPRGVIHIKVENVRGGRGGGNMSEI
jgi:hypothetical protein